ncbi:MAG: hypothetical protein JWP36_2154 [Paucimonas sp.]|nr:hypothetical protein [Paucimonas sp.]
MTTRLKLTRLVAIAVGCVSFSAHAQLGGFANMFGDMLQKQTAQKKEKEAKSGEAPIAKKWPDAKQIPAEVLKSAREFAVENGPPELQPLLVRLYVEGERNATLNLERIGLAAMAAGKLPLAEQAFDAAIERIELVYADNAQAKKAKSLWTAEKIKDFKGEPYERAMAYYYRGLLYAARNDYQNARAMFIQADYQDTVAEAETFAGDFALMPYLAGWSSVCDGNAGRAKEFYERAVKIDDKFREIRVDQKVLTVFESGRIPFKYGAGKHGEQLRWQPRDNSVEVAGTCTDSCPYEKITLAGDVAFQATTRGGRPIDAILNGKASFKDGASSVGDVANTLGLASMQVAANTGNSDAANLGIFGMLAGLAANVVSAATEAQADTREWEQLPSQIWVGTGSRPSTKQPYTVPFGGPSKSRYELTKLGNGSTCQVYWGRNVKPLNVLDDAGPMEPGEHPRDPVFREEMKNRFGA